MTDSGKHMAEEALQALEPLNAEAVALIRAHLAALEHQLRLSSGERPLLEGV